MSLCLNYPEFGQDVATLLAAPTKEVGRKVAGTAVKEELFTEHHQRESLKWAGELLSEIEDHAASALFAQYQYRLKKGGQPRSANIWLRKSVEQIREHAARFPLPLRMIASELGRANVAREWSNRCLSIVLEQTKHYTHQVNAEQLLIIAMQPAQQWGISPLLPVFNGPQTDDQLDMAASALARLQCCDWWQRQITRAWRRYAEHVAILVGRVRRGVSAYVSQVALKDYRQRKAASAAWLKTMYAINPELELQIPLAEAVASSVSNPELRRVELMVRMRGFEDVAQDQGWVGEFYTWTAPSKFHSWTIGRNKKAIQNPRYQGATPRDTQRYICGQWAKARAKLARLGVKIFGFRVVEPHHDGTPHWHMLFFVHPKQRYLLRWVLRYYACQHDKAELARSYKPRFDWRAIDPTKGSATGYIAKYIAKNIDGHKVDWDDEAREAANTSAQAVAAWSSLWGIRQFQQVGGPSVSVWRELRRLREATQNPILEGARRAASAGKWADFVLAMGGIDAQRKDHAIKLQHLLAEAASRYGEDVKKLTGLRTVEITTSVNGVLSGLMVGHSEATTRHQGWELSRFGLGERSEMSFSERSDQPLSGGSQRPWSSDNNCTVRPDLSEKDPLDREMGMLGLDGQDKKRLLGGSIIQIDGLYIRIRNGALLTSRERPGMQPDIDPLAIWEDNEFAEIERKRIATYRSEALTLLSNGGSLEDWLANIPEQYQQPALDQAAELIDQMEYEASWHGEDEDGHANWLEELYPA